MQKILTSLVLMAGAAAALMVGGTGAFFSDTEVSSGNVFTAGAIDLKVDNSSYYNGLWNKGTSWESIDLTNEKFFDFIDLKPGDYGEDTISLHVETNDAYLCADVTLTSNDDNGLNEPEDIVDDTGGVGEGELAGLVNFIWWADDGDNVLEVGENPISPVGPIGALTLNVPYPITLADSVNNIWTGQGGPVPGNETKYIGKAWCFGNLTAAPLTQDGVGNARTPALDNNGNQTAGEPADGGYLCDGSALGNETQTDSLTADISFEAVQARHNPRFQCELPPPVFTECTDPNMSWADGIALADQGRRKDGTAILAARTDATKVLGPAETAGLPSDVVPPGSTFYSLGFGTATTATRSIIVSFNNNIVVDGPGDDIFVYEVTGGTYPDEHVKVEISQNGTSWVTIQPDGVRDISVDINGALPWAKYVRITDNTLPGPFEATADAYDLDAVKALNCALPLVD